MAPRKSGRYFLQIISDRKIILAPYSECLARKNENRKRPCLRVTRHPLRLKWCDQKQHRWRKTDRYQFQGDCRAPKLQVVPTKLNPRQKRGRNSCALKFASDQRQV